MEVQTRKRNGHERRYRLPDECPVCGGEVSRPEDEAVARCVNASCPAVLKESLQHFGSKPALDIDGLGEKLVDQLVERDLVTSFDELFDLEFDDLVALQRLAEKSAQNLLHAIDEAREEVTLPRLLYGLGIPRVGTALAGDLAAHFGTLDRLMKADTEELESLEDVGPTVARAIRDWTRNRQNKTVVMTLRKHGIDPEMERRGERLAGWTLVLTGALESMTRDEAQEAIRRQGGKAAGSVSGETDALVVGSDPGDTKVADAEEHEVRQIDEDEFLRLLGERS